MRNVIIAIVSFLAVAMLGMQPACYKCADEQCSNVPNVEPNYPTQPGDYPADGYQVVEVVPDTSLEAAGSPCGRACANWRRLGCPEAEPSPVTRISCYRVCVKKASLTRVPSACWAAAENIPALRKCGGIRCTP